MSNITVYLAAAWQRRAEIKQIASMLRSRGIAVNSRWLEEEHCGPTWSEKFLRERAIIDVADVKAADVLVRFSDDLSSKLIDSRLATGSRMFEMGLAYGMGKPILVVGGHQPVFDRLPNIVHLPNVDSLVEYLAPEVN